MKQIAGIDSSNFNVLIVDDMPLNLTLLDMMLRPYKFHITKALNGKEALKAIQSKLNTPEKFDLAILDLMMPVMDGYQVIEYTRQGCHNEDFDIPSQSATDLPIIVLSAMNLSDDVSRAMTLGANQFITKPIIQEQLFNAVEHELSVKAESAK